MAGSRVITPWTGYEEKQLRQLATEHTVRFICDTLGRSKHSVVKKLDYLGIAAQPDNRTAWKQSEVKTLLSMVEDFTYREIAEVLGRNESSVRAFVYRNDMSQGPRKASKEYITSVTPRIIMLHSRGLSYTRIGQLVKISRDAVKRVLIKEGRV